METISQRQLRNDSGEILRRAAAGEEFLIRAGDAMVHLHRAHLSAVERLAQAGLLSRGSSDDLSDLPEPVQVDEPLDQIMDEIRGDR